ncbi:type II toxin-antitoxin system VapC family toxin [Phyllobacterium sp. LjRoot231]|uniref:type II toxin-antitoxin system VapC family toxin n=1 Tax=Phyllobacterium sp. LjRoot231 TaxID=3342289 RepID=UPI003ECE9D77
MFLDASAIIAIIGDEPEAGYLIAKIEMTTKPIYYSSLSAYEAIIGFARKKRDETIGDQHPIPPQLIDQAQKIVEGFLAELKAKEIAIEIAMHRKAVEACRTYGRVVAHPARLNFGDCFAYACAKTHHIPLLYKGDDFSQTDIEAA